MNFRVVSRLYTVIPTVAAFALLAAYAPASHADTLTEGFESLPALQAAGSGWFFQNNSVPATTNLWRQGEAGPGTFGSAQSGSLASYAFANFSDTTAVGAGNISQWMLTPALNYDNGGSITFFTRTTPNPQFADRLQVRFSTAGASTNIGTTDTSVGDFTTLLLDINPTLVTASYPQTWTQFTISLSGLSGPTLGRVGFRYFVTNGGGAGANSNAVGVDTLAINSGVAAVPEPGTLALLLPGAGALLGGVVVRRRRAAK